jgi:uncharacterized protein with FMN-binding domain
VKKALIITIVIALLGIASLSHKNDQPSVTLGDNTTSASNTASPSTPTTNNRSSSSPAANPNYKDGTYTGDTESTPYGEVQIAVVVSGGKISDIRFLEMPSDRGHSQEITAESEPLLKQTTLDSQSANIDFVSGATSTSYGYQASLQSALDKAAGSSAINLNNSSVTV